jgi:hypothetical protein
MLDEQSSIRSRIEHPLRSVLRFASHRDGVIAARRTSLVGERPVDRAGVTPLVVGGGARSSRDGQSSEQSELLE